MAQVKWLTRIEVVDRRYEGRHMARNYQSLRAMKTPEGKTLSATVISKGKTANVTVPHVDQMSDAELADRVRSILRNAGLDLEVQVTDGHLMIQDKK